MRVLLWSTYELGQQPLGIAGLAGRLAEDGHELRVCDLSVDAVDTDDLAWAEALCCSVPMHTALRLALAALAPARRAHPDLPVALHGLYAPVGAGSLRDGDLAVAGESLEVVAEWLSRLRTAGAGGAQGAGVTVRIELGRPGRSTGPASTRLPDRRALPPLDAYARLLGDGPDRLVGTVEASRGCSHRCRHCPVPTVYDGRTRVVPVDEVLADIAQCVAAGARHIHFADPDFLNRPAHAVAVAAGLAERFADVSFDATIKVSHVLAHRDVIETLGAAGCVFVVTALESTSPTVLARLDKGHTIAQAAEAIAVLRDASIEVRPSFLPFTPWTTLADTAELLDFVAAYDLVESVDPVQYGIRLLLPRGSLLLEQPDETLAAAIVGDDESELEVAWRSPDPRVDALQEAIAARTEQAACTTEPFATTYAAVRGLVFAALGRDDPGVPDPILCGSPRRPHLSETWFCCAEPTAAQFGAMTATPA